MQPPFLHSIGDMFQGVVDEFGIDLPADPYRIMVDSGAKIAAGSDFPCAPLNPMIGISVLATRKTAAGTIIAPAAPAFYNRPQSLDDNVNFIAGRVLDLLGLDADLFARWEGG